MISVSCVLCHYSIILIPIQNFVIENLPFNKLLLIIVNFHCQQWMLTYIPKSLLVSPWIKLDIILIVNYGLYKHVFSPIRQMVVDWCLMSMGSSFQRCQPCRVRSGGQSDMLWHLPSVDARWNWSVRQPPVLVTHNSVSKNIQLKQDPNNGTLVHSY